MKRSIIIFFLVPFFLVSCQIAGLTSGYSHLSKKEQAKIINYKGKIDEIHDYSKIYTVTVEQVKEYLSNHNNVIIYDYTPFCKSSFCFPSNFAGAKIRKAEKILSRRIAKSLKAI